MMISPMARGMLVVPRVIGAKNALGFLMTKFPNSTPSPMAAKIHTVR